MMVSPKAIKDGVDIKNKPGTAGSGPYIATELVPQEKLVLKRADSYWDPNVGRLGGIELQRVPDAAARLNGLQSGQVDLAPLSSANEIATAEKIVTPGSGLQKHNVKFKNLVGVYLRATKGDVAKLEVRQAIAHAIDPAAIGALFSGTCTPTRQLVPETDPSRIPNYTYPYEFSVDKAKALVQQAGGAKVTVTFAAGTNAEQPANVVQASLRAIGIDATLNPVPNTENEPRFIAGDFELMVATSWSPKAGPGGDGEHLPAEHLQARREPLAHPGQGGRGRRPHAVDGQARPAVPGHLEDDARAGLVRAAVQPGPRERREGERRRRRQHPDVEHRHLGSAQHRRQEVAVAPDHPVVSPPGGRATRCGRVGGDTDTTSLAPGRAGLNPRHHVPRSEPR